MPSIAIRFDFRSESDPAGANNSFFSVLASLLSMTGVRLIVAYHLSFLPS